MIDREFGPLTARYIEEFQSRAGLLKTPGIEPDVLDEPAFAALKQVFQAWNLKQMTGENPAVTAAREWAEGRGIRTDGAPVFWQESEHLALARILLAGGRWTEVQSLLARLAPAAVAGGRAGRLIEILVLQALALRQADHERALKLLEQALVLAEPSGYVRTFLDEGQPLAGLLQELTRRSGPARAYAARLSSGFSFAKEPGAHPAAALPEPLTDRELEVRRLLAAGLSNEEMTGRLQVTYGTVKTHVHNIYGKLGANSRVRAVALAREMRLL